MTLHLEECLDLTDRQVLPIPEGDQFIKGTEDVEGMLEDFAFVQALAYAADNLGEEVEGVDVLEDVGLLVRDEDHVELVERLVDEADIVLLDGGMLCSGVCGLGESGEESFDARPLHIVKRSGKDGLAAAGADGRCEDNLPAKPPSVTCRPINICAWEVATILTV